MKKAAGYTLVEVVVSIVVGMVIIAAIYAAVVIGQRSTVNIERKVVADQDARAALELMALEIQMASFNPNYATGVWRNPANLQRGHPAIRITGGSRRRPPLPSPSRRTSTKAGCWRGSQRDHHLHLRSRRTSTSPVRRTAAAPSLFWETTVASGRPRSVRVINTAAVPVFRYFNAQGTEIAPRDCRRRSRISPGSTSPCGWRRRISMRIRGRDGGWSIPRASFRGTMSSVNHKKRCTVYERQPRGFALVTAILAIMILMALGYLVISVSTGDLKISSRVVGEKKALSAAETGIHRMMQNFDPANMAAVQATERPGGCRGGPGVAIHDQQCGQAHVRDRRCSPWRVIRSAAASSGASGVMSEA